jgi:hypothetical protein
MQTVLNIVVLVEVLVEVWDVVVDDTVDVDTEVTVVVAVATALVVVLVVAAVRCVVGRVVISTHSRKKVELPTTVPPAFRHFAADEHWPSKSACPFLQAMQSLAPAGHSYLEPPSQRHRSCKLYGEQPAVNNGPLTPFHLQ